VNNPLNAAGVMIFSPFAAFLVFFVVRPVRGRYDPIQGQAGLTVVKMADFKVYLLRRYAYYQKTNSKL